MKGSSHTKDGAQLSDTLLRQVNLYALGAAAAGAGMLAQPAEAKIVYTPITLRLTNATPLDLNNDGTNDFVLHTRYFVTSTFNFQTVSVRPYFSNEIAAKSAWAAALPAGARVGNGRKFSKAANVMAKVRSTNQHGSSAQFSGPWADGGKGVKNRYLGLQFSIKGKVHYGWARLNVRYVGQQFRNQQATLTGYAYETIPNKAIITGKTKGSGVITMPPGTLGNLALGKP